MADNTVVFPPGTKATVLMVRFIKDEDNKPVSTEVEIHACFYPRTTTPAPPTTAAPTTPTTPYVPTTPQPTTSSKYSLMVEQALHSN